jgi:hypothetical protein
MFVNKVFKQPYGKTGIWVRSELMLTYEKPAPNGAVSLGLYLYDSS